MRTIFAMLTGGRPMQRQDYRFTDVVSGKPVFHFRDFFGRLWLAEHPWALFRVEAKQKEAA